jgi:hypothetical protein
MNATDKDSSGNEANLIVEWLGLFNRAIIPALVQHPAWLQPMLSELAPADDKVKLVLGYTKTGQDLRLTGLAALKRTRFMEGYIFPVSVTWDSGFLFSGVPLLDSDEPASSLHELLVSAGEQQGAKSVLFRKVPLEGPFFEVVESLAANYKVPFRVFDEHERAALFCNQDYAAWFEESFSKKRRKEFRRLSARLSELGEVRREVWRQGDAVDTWVDEFLTLEAAGWKGETGTAVACNPCQTDFLRKSLQALADNNQLMFWRVTLDGDPIATLFALVDGKHAWLGKMAYREDLAKYSPGVMVILEASKSFLNGRLAVSVDSAADPNHPMIDNIWRNRIKTGDVLLSVPGVHPATFSLVGFLEKLRRKFCNYAKRIYNKIRQKR